MNVVMGDGCVGFEGFLSVFDLFCDGNWNSGVVGFFW